MTPPDNGTLLEVAGLSVEIDVPAGVLHAVRDIDFSLARGETLAIVGESGCGKTMTALAIMRLLPRKARIRARRIALEGQLLATPPATELRVPRPGSAPDGTAAFSRYLLTGRGKTGVAPEVLEQAGRWVKLDGTLISRNQLAVIAARSAEPLPGPPAGHSQAEASDPGPGTSLGRVSLTGEIVDSKCYPGVMKPGQGKTHRACAIRCLSGGVPAVFRVASSSAKDAQRRKRR